MSAATGGYCGATLAWPWLVQHDPPEATATRVLHCDGADLRVHLASTVAASLLAVIDRDEPGDSDTAGRADKSAIGSGELDRVLFSAFACLALGLLGYQAAQNRPAVAALIWRMADLLSEVSITVPLSGEPAGPTEPLTRGETRVLRYLTTHMSAREIAAELCLSDNTIKTHLRHLYWKLGAHSRNEAVHRARTLGLLAPFSRQTLDVDRGTSWPTGTPNATSPSYASLNTRRGAQC